MVESNDTIVHLVASSRLIERFSTRSMIGRRNESVLPLAVPVVTTTLSPRRAASNASAWCEYSWAMPRAASAACRAG